MSEKRHLTRGEIALLESVYGERDYFNKTTIERGSFLVFPSFGMVSNNNIRVGKTVYSNDFSQTHPAWFIHEGAHLVQEQSFGKHLLGSKLGDKTKSLFKNNYQYADDVEKGVPFDEMTIEAQASMIADYFRAVQGYRGRYATLPLGVYREKIPAGFVPHFGRTRGSDQGEPAGVTDPKAPVVTDAADAVIETEGVRFQSQPAPAPRRKPTNEAGPHTLPQGKPAPRGQPIDDPTQNVPMPLARPGGRRSLLDLEAPNQTNPFDARQPQLKLQADLLDRSPVLAKQLIVRAGRDPRLFGL